MAEQQRRWARFLWLIGALAVFAGVGVLTFGHDEGRSLGWLFIGSVIVATTSTGGRHRCRPSKSEVDAKRE